MKHLKEGLIKQRGVVKSRKHFSKKDLQDGDIVISRSGLALVVYKNNLIGRGYIDVQIELSSYTDDLLNKNLTLKDIISVYRPTGNLKKYLTNGHIYVSDTLKDMVFNHPGTQLMYDRNKD